MGSVSDEAICPKCKALADVEFYYKTGDYRMLCVTCGYHEEGSEHGVERGGGKGAYRIRYARYSQVGAFVRRKPASARFKPAFIARRRVLAITVTERVRGKWKTVTIKADPKASVRDWTWRMKGRNSPKKTYSMDTEDIEF